MINNNNQPKNGPPACPWILNNCGCNDEMFSMHVGGAHALIGDGAVRFLSENLQTHVVRMLADPKDGGVIGEF